MLHLSVSSSETLSGIIRSYAMLCSWLTTGGRPRRPGLRRPDSAAPSPCARRGIQSSGGPGHVDQEALVAKPAQQLLDTRAHRLRRRVGSLVSVSVSSSSVEDDARSSQTRAAVSFSRWTSRVRGSTTMVSSSSF